MSDITRRRKSSASITLVLISASALTACGQSSGSPDTLRRDMYTSQADCTKDWGAEADKCQPQTTRTSSGSSYTHFYGPAYRSGDYGSSGIMRSAGTTGEARPGSHASATSFVSHGGFGGSSMMHGAGLHASSGS